jgi:magnesium-protoporphyrin O-methyltransferase
MSRGLPQRFCCDEDLALIGYDGASAAANLASLRKNGPRRETQELIDVIVRHGVRGATVLDIGAGVGAVHLGLLEAGAARAVDADASREYQAAAREEAARRGVAARVEYRFGDVVELAPELPPADIVTLDSVICCYPYLDRLLGAAVLSGPRLVGIAYPRDAWFMVAFMRLYNLMMGIRRSVARYFIYRHEEVRRGLASLGYDEVHDGGSRVWRVAVFTRRQPNAS